MKSSPARQGRVAWLMQRFTAALLLFYLGVHLWALHLAKGGREIDSGMVSLRLRSPFFQIVDMVLIGLVLYHGLYGSRGIIFDAVAGRGSRRAVTWGLLALGLAAFLLAIRAYLAFLGAF